MWIRFINSSIFDILYPITLLIAVGAGYVLSDKFYKSKNRIWNSTGADGAVIGFFALLLSFTFSTAGDSMKERNSMVHQLADATADLRRQSLFVSDTLKGFTKDYLLEYLNQQINFNTNLKKDKYLFRKQIGEVNGLFLTQLTAYSKQSSLHLQEANLLLPYFNKLNSFFYRLMGLYDEKTPVLIISSIILSSWLIGLLIGFMNASQPNKQFLVAAIFIILVTLTLYTILDLDNPSSGFIKPGYDNFREQKEILMNSAR